MASELDNDMDGLPGESLPPGQDPAPLRKASQKSGTKRKLSQIYDPRVDLMQKQLEDMRKTMDIMAAAQQRLLETQAPQRIYHHPDSVSLAASGNLDKTNSSGCGSSARVEDYEDPDEDLGEAPIEMCDFSLEALLIRAAAAAGLPAPPSPPRASALDRCPGRQGRTLLPVYGDFVARLQESWAQPREATAPRSALSALHGASEHGLDGVSQVGPSFALLAGASTSGRVVRHPNKKCRATDGLVVKSYQSTAMASRLANTNALLLVYLEGLIRDLESKSLADLLPEMTKVMDTVIQGASAQAKALGSAMAQLTMARRHIWLSQTGLDEAEQAAVMGASISPGQVFGAAAEAALDEAQKVRLRSQSIRRQRSFRPVSRIASERRVSIQRPDSVGQSSSQDLRGGRQTSFQQQGRPRPRPRSRERGGRGVPKSTQRP